MDADDETDPSTKPGFSSFPLLADRSGYRNFDDLADDPNNNPIPEHHTAASTYIK